MGFTFSPETGRIISEAHKKETHLGHANHLCNLVELGVDIDAYKTLARNGKFICRKCGRVAAAEKNLCEPLNL